MMMDSTLANFRILWFLRGGNTGEGRVERMSFFQVAVHSLRLKRTGHIASAS